MTAVTEKMRQDMDCPLETVDLSFNRELSRSDDNVVSLLVTIEQHFPEAKCSAEQAHILRGFASALWQFLFDTKHPAVSFANSSREKEDWVNVDDNNHQRLLDALKVIYLDIDTPASFSILRDTALDAPQ